MCQPLLTISVGSPEAKNIDKVLCTIQSIEHEKVKEIEMMRELEETNQKLEEMIHKADEASRAKTDFFSRMSHDMRTPMNGILGIAGLSEEETNIDILHDNISKIEQSGQYLLGLINDTLDLQKIDSGMLKLEPQIVSTRELVNNVLMMIQIECQKKGIQLNMTTSNADLDCLVKVDPMRMKQIFFLMRSNSHRQEV